MREMLTTFIAASARNVVPEAIGVGGGAEETRVFT